MNLKTRVFLLLFMLLAHCALAETTAKSPAQGWSLGLGAAYSSSPYRGINSEIRPFPLLSYQGERFFLRGPQLGYSLFKEKGLDLALLASYRLQGYASSDSPFLQGMSDREGTLEAGVQASLKTSYGQIRLHLLSDLLDEHGGHEAGLTLSKAFHFEQLLISPSVEVLWQSGQLADYYYGVAPAEVAINRAAYKVDSTHVLRVGLMANYMLDKHWFINGRMTVSRLADEISDSPIVSDDVVTNGFIGIGYQF